MTIYNCHYISSLKHKHILSILMLNSVFFFQTRNCLFVYYELNASSDENFCIQTMILKFYLCSTRNSDTSIFFWWLLKGFPSNWNSKSFMNNNNMNLSNNYKNLITSTMSYNWLKDRLHLVLYKPHLANRRRNCLSLVE